MALHATVLMAMVPYSLSPAAFRGFIVPFVFFFVLKPWFPEMCHCYSSRKVFPGEGNICESLRSYCFYYRTNTTHNRTGAYRWAYTYVPVCNLTPHSVDSPPDTLLFSLFMYHISWFPFIWRTHSCAFPNPPLGGPAPQTPLGSATRRTSHFHKP
ncbi:hypothetical protein TRVA0_020S00562 [Trichomonascus vanleenenianus]|uniref:uncharacterized protein n=1 Tax=Trichomonascus vanleenenianus TaxID=2268995 RepID=UPI003ECA0E22